MPPADTSLAGPSANMIRKTSHPPVKLTVLQVTRQEIYIMDAGLVWLIK